MPPDLANQFNPLACKADFTYSMTPKTVKIQDTGKGKSLSPTIWRRFCSRSSIWHQSSIARYRISYTSTQGTEHLVEWDWQAARVRPLE
jgi:hypothetical protein